MPFVTTENGELNAANSDLLTNDLALAVANLKLLVVLPECVVCQISTTCFAS